MSWKKLSRKYKLNRIGQAHLAPGMSLERWRQVMLNHRVLFIDRQSNMDGSVTRVDRWVEWPQVTDETLNAIIEEISAVVQQARSDNDRNNLP